MKYSRLKDGRIVDISIPSRIRTKFLKTHDVQWILEHNADTIEELCDKWVFDTNDETNVIRDIEDYSLLSMQNSLEDKKKYNIRLAIWTDKGLIYVAKMKGVLPNGEIDWELL